MPYSRPRRWPRLLHYGFLAAAGLAGAFAPGPLLAQHFIGLMIYVWILFLAAGSIVAFIGAIRDSWLGEFIGLPLILFAIGGYSLLVIGIFVSSLGSAGSLTAAFLYLGFSSGLFMRWVEVNSYRKVARYARSLNQEE